MAYIFTDLNSQQDMHQWAAEAATTPGVTRVFECHRDQAMPDGAPGIGRMHCVEIVVDRDPRRTITVMDDSRTPKQVVAALNKRHREFVRENRLTRRTIAESQRW